MSIVCGFIVMIIVAYFMFAASRHLDEDEEDEFQFRMLKSIGFSVSTGLVCALAPIAPAIISLVLVFPILISQFYLIIWWKANGSTIKEAVLVSVINLLMMLSGLSAAARILDLTSIRWIAGLIRVLPLLMFIVAEGFFIMDIISFNEYLKSRKFRELCLEEDDEDEEEPEAIEEETILNKIRRRWDNEEIITNDNFGSIGDVRIDC